MFNYLKGRLVSKKPAQAIIEAGPIGYEVTISLSTYDALPAEGEPVSVLTHFHVREDHQQLFGFISPAERDLFRLLIAVSGIGPRTAVAILSGISAQAFRSAILNGNVALLTSISGVGRKTAERIVLELREKVGLEAMTGSQDSTRDGQDVLLGDAVSALVSLGYRHQAARQAVQKILRETQNTSAEELVREALKVV